MESADGGRLRASPADRDQAIAVLKVAFVQGRLSMDEFDARTGQALISRTQAELAAVTADLPSGLAGTRPSGQTVPYDLGGRVLEVTGSPGHHRAAITVYDPWTAPGDDRRPAPGGPGGGRLGGRKAGIHRSGGFIIYNEPRIRDQFRLMGRGLLPKAHWAWRPRSR